MVRIEEAEENEPTTVRAHGRVGVQGSVPGQAASSQVPNVGSQGGASMREGHPFPIGIDRVFFSGPGFTFSGFGPGGNGHGPSSATWVGFGPDGFTSVDGSGPGFVQVVEMPPLRPDMLAKPRPPVVQPLAVSLEMLYKGGTVNCCIKSQATDAIGPVEPQRIKNFEVEIMPGYRHGTQIKFDSCFPGEELYPGEPKVDVTFVVEEEKHDLFKRKGKHLHADIKLSKEQLEAPSFEYSLKLISGEMEKIQGSRGSCAHGAKRTLKGLGMPIRRAGQATPEFGDLILRFSWPLSLRTNSCCIVS